MTKIQTTVSLILGFAAVSSFGVQAGGPSVLFVVDSSVSMDEKMGMDSKTVYETSAERAESERFSTETRFEVMKDTVSSAIKNGPQDQPLGLSAFGMERGCDEANLKSLVPSATGDTNRSEISVALRNMKIGHDSPLVLSMQRAVKDATGVLIPIKKKKDGSEKFNVTPDANTPKEGAGKDAPTIVFFTDVTDNCGADACQFIKDLQNNSDAKVNLRIVGIGMRKNYKGQAILNCFSQFSKVQSMIATSSTDLKYAVKQILIGEDLAKAQKLSPENIKKTSFRARTTTEVSGRVLLSPKQADSEKVEKVEIEELHAVALPLDSIPVEKPKK